MTPLDSPSRASSPSTHHPRRWYWLTADRLWWTRVWIIGVWGSVVMGCGILAAAVIIDNYSISHNYASTTAIVVNASPQWSMVQFYTPDGMSHFTQEQGISFPSHLAAGQKIIIEYDTNNLENVRVRGRKVTLIIWPLCSVIGGCGLSALVALGVLHYLSNSGRIEIQESWQSPWQRWKHHHQHNYAAPVVPVAPVE